MPLIILVTSCEEFAINSDIEVTYEVSPYTACDVSGQTVEEISYSYDDGERTLQDQEIKWTYSFQTEIDKQYFLFVENQGCTANMMIYIDGKIYRNELVSGKNKITFTVPSTTIPSPND